MARVLTVAQRKGGCGKSSLAVTLSAVGVSRAFQIGTVDLDSQGNSSSWALGTSTVRRVSRETSAAMLEYPPRPDWLPLSHPLRAPNIAPENVLEYVRQHCAYRSGLVPGLTVYPSTPSVHFEDAGELLLRELPGDWVVVDTPADTSTPATRAALAQSDYVLVPVLANAFSIWATETLFRELEIVGRTDLIETGRVRLLINGRQKWAVQDLAETELRDRYGDLVIPETVPWTVRISEASMSPQMLKKTNPIWKAAERVWDELEPRQTNRKERAA